MAKRTYRTRDPKPMARDPQPEEPPEVQHIDHVPVIRQEPIKCAACGGPGIWRPGGTTVPNVSTREMFRWRSCIHCKQTQYIARAMTADEMKRYLAPKRV